MVRLKKNAKKEREGGKKIKNLLHLWTDITNSKIPERTKFDQRPNVSRRSLGRSNLWPNLLMAEFQRRWEGIKKERKTWKKFKCGRNESYIKRGRQSKTIKRCSNSTVFHYVKLHDPFSTA